MSISAPIVELDRILVFDILQRLMRRGKHEVTLRHDIYLVVLDLWNLLRSSSKRERNHNLLPCLYYSLIGWNLLIIVEN
jgi:hypothetical protein